jgi:enoyl-CoA hydratase/carnithine racemase
MEQVRERIVGNVGIIELINPPHNFMNSVMIQELDGLTFQWERDPAISAVVITGGMKDIFITHYSAEEIVNELSPLGGMPAPVKGLVRLAFWFLWHCYALFEGSIPLLRLFECVLRKTKLRGIVNLRGIHRVFNRLQSMDKPVVAAINGEALGGGCELAISCDYRLMADGDFRIGLIEALLGITPGAGGNRRLARLVGAGKALGMILDGTVVDPIEARRIGLVDKVVRKKDLMDEAMKLARRLANRPAAVVGGVKRLSGSLHSAPPGRCAWLEKKLFCECGYDSCAKREGERYLGYLRKGMRPRDIYDLLRERDERVTDR